MAQTALELYAQAMEAAKQLEDRLATLKTQCGENWDGNEDYVDAISYVADLFNWASEERQFRSYQDDPAASEGQRKMMEARHTDVETDGMHARDSLKRYWNIGQVTVDDI